MRSEILDRFPADVFSGLDGYGAHKGNWGGYWGKQGPELIESRTLDGNTQELVYRPTLHS